MAKRRNSFAKLGIVCVVLMMALGMTGVSYALWLQPLGITGTVETGSWNPELTSGNSSDPDIISFSAEGDGLAIMLNHARAGTYHCDFSIRNRGTIPIRIASIIANFSGVPEGVTVDVKMTAAGMINPGQIRDGRINVSIADGGREGISCRLQLHRNHLCRPMRFLGYIKRGR